jgi:hypothetical protein
LRRHHSGQVAFSQEKNSEFIKNCGRDGNSRSELLTKIKSKEEEKANNKLKKAQT